MYKYFKIIPLVLFTLAIVFAKSAWAESTPCPTDVIKPFAGTWEGTAVLTLSNGTTLNSGTRDIFTIHGCHWFDLDVNYLDSSGNVARKLHLDAIPEGSSGLFTVKGTITEGPNPSTMSGTIERSQEGKLLGHFSGAIGGKNAYLSEVMELIGEKQLVRTIRMSAVSMGSSDIGTRVVHDRKTQQ